MRQTCEGEDVCLTRLHVTCSPAWQSWRLLADYDLHKTSHKRFHLVVSRAVTAKKCAKQCAHVLFRRCRCRRRLRCSNRLYCFNPPIVAMSLQSMLRWPLYTRPSISFYQWRRREPGCQKKQLKPLPHTSGYFWKMIFFSIFSPPSTSHKRRFQAFSAPPPPPPPKKKDKKTGFRKLSPEWVFFENGGLSFSCERAKTEVFEYDDVIHTNWSRRRIIEYFSCHHHRG